MAPTNKQRNDRRKRRKNSKANDVLGELLDWQRPLLIRWLFAQVWNKHQPQGIQQRTKDYAREVATDLLATMDLDIMATTPRGLENDPKWTDALGAVSSFDAQRRWLWIAVLVEQTDPPPQVRDQLSRLGLLYADMVRQQAANKAGWIIGVGWKDGKKR